MFNRYPLDIVCAPQIESAEEQTSCSRESSEYSSSMQWHWKMVFLAACVLLTCVARARCDRAPPTGDVDPALSRERARRGLVVPRWAAARPPPQHRRRLGMRLGGELRLRGGAVVAADADADARVPCGGRDGDDGDEQGARDSAGTAPRAGSAREAGEARAQPEPPLLASESERLATFRAFPPESLFPLTAQRLAAAGFAHSPDAAAGPDSDRCVCTSCHLALHQWQRMDDPALEHLRHHRALAAADGRGRGATGGGRAAAAGGGDQSEGASEGPRLVTWKRECKHLQHFVSTAESYMQEAVSPFSAAVCVCGCVWACMPARLCASVPERGRGSACVRMSVSLTISVSVCVYICACLGLHQRCTRTHAHTH